MKDMNTKSVAAAVGLRDVVVVVMLCVFIVMTAGALYTGGSMRAKTLMCTVNLQRVGQGMAAYWGLYDGKMPTMNAYGSGGQWQYDNCIRPHYVYSVYYADATPNQEWMLLGCLFKAGTISDGRTFYCPATEGSLDEYLSYSNPGPWGSNIDQQAPNIGPGATGNIWLRARKGYVYWPQGREMVKAGWINPYGSSPMPGYAYLRYEIGKPAPPFKASDLDMTKVMAVDGEPQRDSTGGYKVNTLFPDGHTNYQFVPKYDGKWIGPYQHLRPLDIDPAEWYGDGVLLDSVTKICNYMYLLEP